MSALIPRRDAAKRVGVSLRTLIRYEDDPEMDFPVAVNVSNRRFYNLDEIEAWIESRPRVTEVPTVRRNTQAEEVADANAS
jgi:predicted DNA-binding transcriptional regulator AlpA